MNASKSFAMIVSCCNRIHVTDDLPQIRLDGNQINLVEYAKNLGLYLDDLLIFERHVNELIRKVYFSLEFSKSLRTCNLIEF